ncbi:hypothetical protein CSH63_04285 [Micromonospora tulbaghiae]|uniref:Uncharacterized protein n=1 Tax=Micromonospora tulbaghiae TaxID=479978 RepID=A0A386WF33_9ACTN|nr:hypothetical protein [Micromonospora tulbaghiae]AYF26693.1 hypothetical protein CSH63_04285 [Micromonospora tulbaghiae]
MRNSLMDRAAGNQIDVILTHPRHQQALRDMIGLIADLRRCRLPVDLYEFQERLLRSVLETEERWSEIRRVVHRLKKRRGTVPADAPDLESGLDPLDLDAWRLEEEVFERVWRQLKSIGDALAWRAFGYDRRVIVALSRNASPGPMHGKDGLIKEREVIESAWRDNGEFVLHHDLTAALRVGDLSVFRADGSVLLHEVKTNSNRRIKKQDQLLIDTSMVLAGEGTLPSGFTPVRTQIPFVTNLRGLREVLALAHERTGIQAGVVSPGRAVVAASQYAAAHHYREDTFGDRFSTELARYRRKVGIRSPERTLTMTSIDSVARWPTRPPWAIYPLAPEVAASLIADAMFFFVCMSPDAIINRLADVGVRAEWMQRLDGTEDWDKPLLRVAAAAGNRLWFTSLNPEAIAGLMLEFIDLPTWCSQVAVMLGGDVPARTRPWPSFTNEYKTWA